MPQQLIPCNAALLQKEFGDPKLRQPCFDVNMTCLGFLVGLDTVSYMLSAGRLKRALLFSADIPSVGLDYGHKESAALFGDAAVAFVVEASDDPNGPGILSSAMDTHSVGSESARCMFGTTLARNQKSLPRSAWEFQMDGKAILHLSSQLLPNFLRTFMTEQQLTVSDVDLFVPHQASRIGIELTRRLMDIPIEKVMTNYQTVGNTVSVSIPLALHDAIEQGRLKRGQTALLVGTSAGFSMAVMALRL